MAAQPSPILASATFDSFVIRPPRELSEALREELFRLQSLSGWISAVVTRRDGLAIQHTFRSGHEAASLCAMAAAFVGSARATGSELAQGPFSHAFVQYLDGILLVVEAGDEAILACLMKHDANLGLALTKVSQVAKRIAERLQEF